MLLETAVSRIPSTDPYWPDWYAECIVAEQAGTQLPT
jgi:hypothetical protein